MHARLSGPKILLTLPNYFPSLADEIAEPHPDMNIKVAAFTVSEKSINTLYDDNLLQNVFQRKARWNLRETTAGSDLELLEAAIEKCKKCKLGGTDEDFLRAKRRLKYLKLKKGNTSLSPN